MQALELKLNTPQLTELGNQPEFPIGEIIKDKQSFLLSVKSSGPHTSGQDNSVHALIDPFDNQIFIHAPGLSSDQPQESSLNVLRVQKLSHEIIKGVRGMGMQEIDYPDPATDIHLVTSKKEFDGSIIRIRDPQFQLNVELAEAYQDDPITAGFIQDVQEGKTINNLMYAHAAQLRTNAFAMEKRELLKPKPRERDVWLELDADVLRHNIKELRELLGPKIVMIAMVKADAYGHGMVDMAKLMEKTNEIAYYGVVCTREARELREAGIKTPILIINDFHEDGVEEAVKQNATITVMNVEMLKAVAQTANRLGRTTDNPLKIHIEVNTGMNRGGAKPNDALKLINLVGKRKDGTPSAYPNVELEGVFTHFASADEKDYSSAEEQLRVFNEVLDEMENRSLELPPLIHTANSGGTLQIPDSHKKDPKGRINGARPGLALYGYAGLPEEIPSPINLQPVATLKARLLNNYPAKAGERVGYGGTHILKRPSRIGIVPVGYEDFLDRRLNGKQTLDQYWHLLINGQSSPILGKISMDACAIDLTDIPDAKRGDEVVILGKQGNAAITADDYAKRLDTNANEILTRIDHSRVSREIINDE